MEIETIRSWKSHICIVFGYDLLCDLLEMLEIGINIGALLQLAEA
jgi:hypothetical protein